MDPEPDPIPYRDAIDLLERALRAPTPERYVLMEKALALYRRAKEHASAAEERQRT
ncbi:MAG TPA: hypothetical protein VGS12_11235 [Caulobacteraceae bacterium]|nr:hypothetical protein [Caulobacteraceae bacterium]